MRFPRRIEAKILYNSPFPPITDRGAAPWPDMEKLIAQCTMPKEKARPSAGDIVSAMKGYGFRHLRRKLQLSGKGLPEKFQVTCITGIPCEDESDALRLALLDFSPFPCFLIDPGFPTRLIILWSYIVPYKSYKCFLRFYRGQSGIIFD